MLIISSRHLLQKIISEFKDEPFSVICEVSGETILKIILDVFCRFCLSVHNLRGKTYDGAANMAGIYKGAQAIISRKQPLAPFVHCLSHCINLATANTVESVTITRNAVSLVNELGQFVSNSPKLKSRFANRISSLQQTTLKSPRPVCPTRFLVRGVALSNIYDNLKDVVEILDDIASDAFLCSQQQTMASSFSLRLQQCDFIFGCRFTQLVCSKLEKLNLSSQAVDSTVSGMVEATKIIFADLKYFILYSLRFYCTYIVSFNRTYRSDEHFSIIYEKVEKACDNLEIDVNVPRKRLIPKKYSGNAESHVATTPIQYYKEIYYQVCNIL